MWSMAMMLGEQENKQKVKKEIVLELEQVLRPIEKWQVSEPTQVGFNSLICICETKKRILWAISCWYNCSHMKLLSATVTYRKDLGFHAYYKRIGLSFIVTLFCYRLTVDCRLTSYLLVAKEMVKPKKTNKYSQVTGNFFTCLEFQTPTWCHWRRTSLVIEDVRLKEDYNI